MNEEVRYPEFERITNYFKNLKIIDVFYTEMDGFEIRLEDDHAMLTTVDVVEMNKKYKLVGRTILDVTYTEPPLATVVTVSHGEDKQLNLVLLGKVTLKELIPMYVDPYERQEDRDARSDMHMREVIENQNKARELKKEQRKEQRKAKREGRIEEPVFDKNPFIFKH